MQELKSCPFCGGEAHLTSDYSSERDHTFYQVWHDCQTSPGTIRHSYGHALSLQVSTPWCANEEDAVRLWNRRAERTCRMVDCGSHDTCVVNRELGNGNIVSMEFGYKRCSECGADVFDCPTVRYCPNCGARVS